MKIKKLLVFLGILLVPFVAGAAYNDVTLTTDTVISVGGYNFTVSGTSAVIETLTVNTSDFSFVLLPSSTIQVTSADAIDLYGSSGSGEEFKTVETCTSSQSVTKFTPISSLTNTITVTLGSTCTVATASTPKTSSRSGGGGGGGNVATPAPSATALAVVPTTPAAGKAVFTRLLSAGTTGDDVRNLQIRLLGEGLFKGEATGYFGPLTMAAVKAYQAKYGIDQLGIVGPATRAQLNKVFVANQNSNAAATSQLTPAQVSTITVQISALLQQVQALQAKLKTLSN